MAAILFANFDPAWIVQLNALFRNHQIDTVDDVKSLIELSRRIQPRCDLVILNVSRNDTHTWRYLHAVENIRAKHGIRPMLLCITTIYRGPQFELDLAGC